MNVTYKVTCAGFPLIIEGTIDGHKYEFRNDAYDWSFVIFEYEPPITFDSGLMPIPESHQSMIASGTYVDHPMDEATALPIISRLAEAYVFSRRKNANVSIKKSP